MTSLKVKGGFESVQEQCPSFCVHPVTPTHSSRDRPSSRDYSNMRSSHCSNTSTIPTPSVREPAEILPYLYLGDESHSSQQSVLDRFGITALINVSSSCNNHFEEKYRYMNIHIHDSMNADLYSWFPAVNKFIDEVAAQNGKVLVHCLAGISRSATACIAYLMQKQRISLEKAFDLILARRPIIDPNLNFIQQLQKFEPQCLQKQYSQMSHIPPPSPRPCHQASNVFSFSPVSPHQPALTSSSSTTHGLSWMSSTVPYSSQACRGRADVTTSSSSSALDMQELSPSSLSQTAASPNPLRVAPSRPKSLAIPQLNASFPPHHHQHHHRCSLSPTNLTRSYQGTEHFGCSSSHLLLSQPSPLLKFTHSLEDEVAVAVPVPQGPGFDFFPSESSVCPPSPSAQQPHHPTASTSHQSAASSSSSLSPFLSAAEKTSFPSPISPHAVSLSPLSPVPSFG